MQEMLQDAGYTLDPASHVWAKPGYASIAYSDGQETEARIASVVADASDLSSLSGELRQHCTDWPSRYHLSASRANILRPLEKMLKGDILEIGAGCGAITRYLGECGANVLALEGTMARAAIARARTRDLDSVTVLAENFNDFSCEHQFDVITLIGVLEYAGMFTLEADPAYAMLQRVRQLLKPDGRLVIAIENQLGLKYFAGAPEDHLGQPMVGVEGRYREKQPQTFGKRVLEEMIRQAGFARTDFMAPFPDYKLPVSIVTEQGFANQQFDAAAFAWQSVKRDPQLPEHCSFSPVLAWPQVMANGIGIELSNSFLVVASLNQQESVEKNRLAFHYSTERVPKYCKETVFVDTGTQGIRVLYRKFRAQGQDGQQEKTSPVRFVVPDSDRYVSGRLLLLDFVRLLGQDEWTFEQVAALLRRYLSILQDYAASSGLTLDLKSPYSRLPGKFLDLIFGNIIVTEQGEACIFDQEWVSTKVEGIELGYLLTRVLYNVIDVPDQFGHVSGALEMTRRQFVDGALLAVGLPIRESDHQRYRQTECAMQHEIAGFDGIDCWSEKHLLSMSETYCTRQTAVDQLSYKVRGVVRRLRERVRTPARPYEAEAQKMELHYLESEVNNLEQRNRHLEHERAAVINELRTIQTSTMWRMSGVARRVGTKVPPRVRHWMRRAAKVLWWMMTPHRMPARIQFLRERKHHSLPAGIQMAPSAPPIIDYDTWIARNDTIDDAMRVAILRRIGSVHDWPLLSVVMPVYNPRPKWLAQAIESVRMQLYPHWELCIADDASTDPAIRPLLEQYASQDSRIKVVFRPENGHISAASNSALALASGDWIVLLDHDDLLPEHALYCVADAIMAHSTARLIYSDEDKVDEAGHRRDPYFKCDWNIDLFLSHNMLSHLGVYQRALVERVGGFRQGLEGSQDYDLALRCIELAGDDTVYHIPRVLYHWRVHSGSTASSIDAKSYAVLAGKRAIDEHFARMGVDAHVEWQGSGYRAHYALPRELPLVSLIVPTRNGLELIRQCISSICKKTLYPNYEILVIDNNSDDPETLRYFESLAGNPRIRIIRDERPFNYSALNNAAVHEARGELIGLVNNDIEVITPEWLGEMVSLALQSKVGAVGAKLLYPDDTVQHAGVVLGIGGVVGHLHKHIPRNSPGYMGWAGLIRSFSAVTAACLIIRKSIYLEVGGLDEKNLPVAFNDVDFCIRVRNAGYRNIWTPYAELYHHESATRGAENTPEKRARARRETFYLKARWGDTLLHDPAYSPNLRLNWDDAQLADQSRVPPLVKDQDLPTPLASTL